MKRFALAVLLVSALAPLTRAENEPFKTVNVDGLVAALSSERPPTVCDANSKGTRAKEGVIPGAILLTSSSKYNVANELPADKSTPLVFYCANTKCMASHSAAKKALKSGYTNVSILPEGIMGWKQAGQPSAPASKSKG